MDTNLRESTRGAQKNGKRGVLNREILEKRERERLEGKTVLTTDDRMGGSTANGREVTRMGRKNEGNGTGGRRGNGEGGGSSSGCGGELFNHESTRIHTNGKLLKGKELLAARRHRRRKRPGLTAKAEGIKRESGTEGRGDGESWPANGRELT